LKVHIFIFPRRSAAGFIIPEEWRGHLVQAVIKRRIGFVGSCYLGAALEIDKDDICVQDGSGEFREIDQITVDTTTCVIPSASLKYHPRIINDIGTTRRARRSGSTRCPRSPVSSFKEKDLPYPESVLGPYKFSVDKSI
jgi:hypothetical protein